MFQQNVIKTNANRKGIHGLSQQIKQIPYDFFLAQRHARSALHINTIYLHRYLNRYGGRVGMHLPI